MTLSDKVIAKRKEIQKAYRHFEMTLPFLIARIKGLIYKPFLGKLGEGSSIGRHVKLYGLHKIKIGDRVHIAPHSLLNGWGGLEIGNDVIMGEAVSMFSITHLFENTKIPIKYQGGRIRKIVIKSGSYIGHRVIILDGVTIGKNCVIGAGAVVTRDIPDYCVAAGVPAKVIRNLKEKIKRFT